MFRGLFCLLLLVILPYDAVSSSEFGWDFEQTASSSVLNCLTSRNNATFMIFTGLDKYSSVSPDVCTNLQNAKSQGIEKRDVLLVPCPTCSASPAEQITQLVDNINQNCNNAWSQPRRLWIDMNSHSLWPTPWREAGWTKNRKWFEDLIDACVARKDLACGVLSSSFEWKYTLGDESYSYQPATTLPLWYNAEDSHVASFDDFVPFGGFKSPFAKQFYYYVNMCNISVVWQDWAPSW
jgi:hypothetical protein